MFSFVETPLFSKLLKQYLSDDEYRDLQQALIDNPEAETSSQVPAGCGSCVGLLPVAASVAAIE